MTNKGNWAYLLTGLGCPVERFDRTTKEIVPIPPQNIELGSIGIKLQRAFLTEKARVTSRTRRNPNKARFIFYLDGGTRDDERAEAFVHAVHLSLTLIYDISEEGLSIPIPKESIKRGEFVRIDDVAGYIGSDDYFSVMQSLGVPVEVLNSVWRIAPVIAQNQSLIIATSYYRESMGQAWVPDDDVLGIMTYGLDIPLTPAAKASVESAYQNAFKAIEAVIGEPPSDERKLRLKLRGVGIDPGQQVGYDRYGMKPGKEAVLKKLRDMHRSRDKIAAHGKTRTKRVLGYCELKDKQALARHIIFSHMEFLCPSLSSTG